MARQGEVGSQGAEFSPDPASEDRAGRRDLLELRAVRGSQTQRVLRDLQELRAMEEQGERREARRLPDLQDLHDRETGVALNGARVASNGPQPAETGETGTRSGTKSGRRDLRELLGPLDARDVRDRK